MTRNIGPVLDLESEDVLNRTTQIERDAFTRGVKVLDTYKPNWEEHINLPALAMDDVQYCVLGQLYGRWSDGVNRLELRPVASFWGVDASDDIRFAALNFLWSHEIEARRDRVMRS